MRIALWVGTLLLFGESLKAAEKELDFNAIKHYQITLEPGVFGLHREGNTVFNFPGEQTFYVKSTYKPEAKEKDLGFGSLHNPYDESERVSFEPKEKGRRIRSAVHAGPRWAFLDVMARQFLVYHEERKAWQLPADLILDTPRPARDSKGEPTRAETSALRAKLTKELSRERENPDLLAGLTEIPKKWKDTDGSQYVLWIRGTSTPLLTVKCDTTDFKVCLVQRACFLKGLDSKEYAGITSLTRDPKTDTILLLHNAQRKILRVEGSSCHRLTIASAYRLPKTLENTQAIFVDPLNNLWLGLKQAEGSTSASVFVFEASSW